MAAGGFRGRCAREDRRVGAIGREWHRLKGSEDEAALEAFVYRHGWSEYGADATADLVALRRAHARRDADSIKTLAADDMLRLIDNAAIVFHGSGEVIEFAAQSMPAWRPRLGKNFLKQMLQEDLAAEGAFAAKTSTWPRMEGLGGIVRSKVDKTGSLFLLQLDGAERQGRGRQGSAIQDAANRIGLFRLRLYRDRMAFDIGRQQAATHARTMRDKQEEVGCIEQNPV